MSGLSINGTARWKTNLQAIENNMHLLSDFPTLDSVQPYTGPTLFIGGSKSPYIRQDTNHVLYTHNSVNDHCFFFFTVRTSFQLYTGFFPMP